MDRLKSVFETLDNMSNDQFKKEVKGGIGSTYEFAKLVIGGPTCLIKSDWVKLHSGFIKIGAPADLAPSEAHRLAIYIARKSR